MLRLTCGNEEIWVNPDHIRMLRPDSKGTLIYWSNTTATTTLVKETPQEILGRLNFMEDNSPNFEIMADNIVNRFKSEMKAEPCPDEIMF